MCECAWHWLAMGTADAFRRSLDARSYHAPATSWSRAWISPVTVAEVGVGLDVALGVLADFRVVVVVLAEVLEEELGDGGGEGEVGGFENGLEILEEGGRRQRGG
jgi:hypothetical protein